MKNRMTRVMALAAGLVLFGATPVLYAEEAESQIEVLGKGTKDDRRAALKALQELGSDASGALVNGLTHTSFIARGDCARLLGLHGGADVIAALAARTHAVEIAEDSTEEQIAEALKTGEPVAGVRAAAAAAIASIALRDSGAVGDAATALRSLLDEGQAPEVRYEAIRGLAQFALAEDRAAMESLINKEGDPGLGVLAVGYLGKLANGAGHGALVSFVTAEETTGEGEEAKTAWPYGKGWEHARTAAVSALVVGGHARGAELLVADAARSSRNQSIVVPMYRDLAAQYGDAIVPPVIDALEKLSRDKPGQRPAEMLALVGLLIPTGETGVRAMVALMDKGAAEQKEAKETDPNARNPFDMAFTTSVTNTDSMVSRSDFVSHAATRAAMLAVYLERPEPAEGEVDQVRRQFHEALLNSRSQEARRVMIETFTSADDAKVTQAMDAFVDTAGADGLTELATLLEHDSIKVREHLVTKLSDTRMPVTRAREQLIRLSNDSAPSVRKLVWRPLAQSEDKSMLAEFARGMKDQEMEVQYEAAKYFPNLLTRLKAAETDNVDVFEDAVALMMERMGDATAIGAIHGLAEQVQQFDNALWRIKKDGQDEFKEKVRGLVTHSDPDLRSIAGERSDALKNDKYKQAVIDQLRKETEPQAAFGLLMAVDAMFNELPAGVTLASLVPDTAKWLGFVDVKNRYNVSRNLANQAINVLNKINGSSPEATKAVGDELRRIVTEGNKAKVDGKLAPEGDPARREQMTRVAQAISAMQRTRVADAVGLVIDSLIAWSDSSNVTSNARSFLEAFAMPEHRERIQGIDVNVLSDAQKSQIMRQIETRSSTPDGR